MPIAISVRHDFGDSVYRDTFVRMLGAPGITAAYIASGFFSDFVEMQDFRSPDFGITDEMENKSVFLYGAYDQISVTRLASLRDALHKRKLNVHAYALKKPQHPKDTTFRWHAKLAVFLSDLEPVLAITGSSNFTAPSMFGPSEERFLSGPLHVQVESDTYFWKKSNADASQAMHDAMHYWGRQTKTKITFDDEKHDNEIAKLIDYVFESILKAEWEELP